MITKETQTYYTNSYGARFTNEQSAIDDELKRVSLPMKLMGSTAGIIDFSPPKIAIVGGINGMWSGQPHVDQHKVSLLTDVIKYCQELIELHGDQAAIMDVHQGMGYRQSRVITIGPNPLYVPHD